MITAFFIVFALLTAPVAFIKRNEIDPAIRSTATIIEYLLYRVAFTGAMLAVAVVTSLFLMVIFTDGNQTIYVGRLADFIYNSLVGITAGVLAPWLTMLAISIHRLRHSRAA